MTWPKNITELAGVKRLLRPSQGDVDQTGGVANAARALFGPPPKSPHQTASDLIGFLKQADLFQGLTHGELGHLARIVHLRDYRDREYISEEGRPGAALFVLRSGLVEITRRERDGTELLLATLKPPTSFDELAAVGETVRWISARARGPVCLVALGRSDLDVLGANFPGLANKLLKNLTQIIGARLQMLVESQYFGPPDQEPERDPSG